MRILQAANFYGPESGGQRVAIDEVGRGYAGAGHERVLVVPGPADGDESGPDGRRITVRSPRLPAPGGYRVLVDRSALAALLAELAPERVEVSDKLTLPWLGTWAAERGVPAVLWSHERIDGILRGWTPGWFPLPRAADGWNRRLLRRFPTVVCASAYAAEELRRAGATDVRVVPLGVDLEAFSPAARVGPPSTGRAEVRLVLLSRLSAEKRPEVALAVLRALRDRGVDAELTVIGAGPLAEPLRRAAQGLPVTFTGHVHHRGAVAALLASADVALAPCPVEAFGLAALEALACGTPIVTATTGALPELVRPRAGVAALPAPTGDDEADLDAAGAAGAVAVRSLLAHPADERRAAARRRAEELPWSATVAGLLAAHGLTPEPTR